VEVVELGQTIQHLLVDVVVVEATQIPEAELALVILVEQMEVVHHQLVGVMMADLQVVLLAEEAEAELVG
jgi:hypothetical protein